MSAPTGVKPKPRLRTKSRPEAAQREAAKSEPRGRKRRTGKHGNTVNVEILHRSFEAEPPEAAAPEERPTDALGTVRRYAVILSNLPSGEPATLLFFHLLAEVVGALQSRAGETPTLAVQMLDVWTAALPSAVNKEVVGDYLEAVHGRFKANKRVAGWVCVFAAIFWTFVNAASYLLTNLRGRKNRAF